MQNNVYSGTFLLRNSMPRKSMFIFRYTAAEMYEVVVDVQRYREFVPWCIRSDVVKPTVPHSFRAHMEIGFQLVKEQYNAQVTHQKPTLVKVCSDAIFFSYNNYFEFSPFALKVVCSII